MCITHTPARVVDRNIDHPRIALESADVVDDLRTRVDRRLGDTGLARVDRNRHVDLRDQPPDHRHHSGQLIFVGNRRRAGPRAFAADVEQIGPLRDQRRAWATAASASRNCPPSEKLSGVTLTIPIKQRPPRQRDASASAIATLLPAGIAGSCAMHSSVPWHRRPGKSPRRFHRADDLLRQPVDRLLLRRGDRLAHFRDHDSPFDRCRPAPAARRSTGAAPSATGGD